jgi:hypothetical protein
MGFSDRTIKSIPERSVWRPFRAVWNRRPFDKAQDRLETPPTGFGRATHFDNACQVFSILLPPSEAVSLTLPSPAGAGEGFDLPHGF